MASRSLTDKQKLFVREYLKDLNATQAAKRAGYSEKTCAKIGGQLLAKTSIINALKELQERRNVRLELQADDVVKNILRIAEKAENAGEFGAALKGQELLGKHLALFTDKKEVTGAGGAPLVIRWESDDDSK